MSERRGTGPTIYVVKGRAKRRGARTVIVRRYRGKDARERATEKALSLNMDVWDDLWVEPEEDKRNQVVIFTPPPKPWAIRQRLRMHHLVDANGKVLACLYGSTETKEFVGKAIAEALAAQGAVQRPGAAYFGMDLASGPDQTVRMYPGDLATLEVACRGCGEFYAPGALHACQAQVVP